MIKKFKKVKDKVAISISKLNHRQELILARTLVCLGILIMGAVLAIAFAAMRPEPKKRSRDEMIRTLEAIPVKQQSVRLQISGYGAVEPIREVLISSELKGRIVTQNIELKEGKLVEKGEVLAEIDLADYKITLEESKAEVARLKTEINMLEEDIKNSRNQFKSESEVLELDRSNLDRQRKLLRRNVVTRKAFEDTMKEYTLQEKTVSMLKMEIERRILEKKSMEAKLKQAMAQQQMAEINVGRSVIRSPFRARIKKVYIDNGEYVQPGTQLFELADDSELEIPVSLDVYDVVKVIDLKSGTKGHYDSWFMRPENVAVEIQWTEAPKRCLWCGEVVRVKDLDKETRTLTLVVRPVKACAPSGESLPLVAGMFCKVTFKGRTIKGAVKVPWIAVQYEMNDVFVVDSDSRIEKRLIEVAGTEGDFLIASSGLKEGEKLIVQRIPRGITNGMKIKTVLPQRLLEANQSGKSMSVEKIKNLQISSKP